MPNRGLMLGIRPYVRGFSTPEAAGRKGDPQWHAGEDPPSEEACGSWPLHQCEQQCYDRSEDLQCDAETW